MRKKCSSYYGRRLLSYGRTQQFSPSGSVSYTHQTLLDQLEDWQEVLDLAIKAGNTEIQEKVEKQIRKINEKLKF